MTNALLAKLREVTESCWITVGNVAGSMFEYDQAVVAFEHALRHNPFNVKALAQMAMISRQQEQYPKAIEYFERVLNIEQRNGLMWGALGSCYLVLNDLQKAYSAYQNALYHLGNPKDPSLWYAIGILYYRYGSFAHAEEAFMAVLNMDPYFERKDEIIFRLGIIFKQQTKYEEASDCFRAILQHPPNPLDESDIWFQIGHIYSLMKEYNLAKDAYERVLDRNQTQPKVLQQMGWLYNQDCPFRNQDMAISYIMRSIDAEPTDARTWYLLGRCYMTQQKYKKSYDAYQQAIYRESRDPGVWCSIGVLYYETNHYREALDAYSRAIRINPFVAEVWFNLGTLYQACNQISDALDAYDKAAELDPKNEEVAIRLSNLRANPPKTPQGKPTVVEADAGQPLLREVDARRPQEESHPGNQEQELTKLPPLRLAETVGDKGKEQEAASAPPTSKAEETPAVEMDKNEAAALLCGVRQFETGNNAAAQQQQQVEQGQQQQEQQKQKQQQQQPPPQTSQAQS